jgi:transcriptional adapter 2-beta
MCLGRGGWSAREELHLLDAIEQFGFGNWEDISRHIETRSPEGNKLFLCLVLF